MKSAVSASKNADTADTVIASTDYLKLTDTIVSVGLELGQKQKFISYRDGPSFVAFVRGEACLLCCVAP